MRIETRVRIGKDKIFLGKGVRELLEAIEEHHSIKQATQVTGISYPKAIRMLRTLDEELGFEVVVSEKGGNAHGGTRLTEKGSAVLEAYRKIEAEVEEFSDKMLQKYFRF